MTIWASAFDHERTMAPRAKDDRTRRGCPYCRTHNRITHYGLANGVGMMSGCEWHVRKWVKDPLWRHR